MSDLPASREEKRERVLANIERNRAEMRLTLHQLSRPMQAVERWQDRARTIWPIMPGLLMIGGVLWVCLKALRGRPRSAPTGTSGSRRSGGALATLLMLVNAYRIATQVRTLMQAGAIGSRTTTPTRRPVAPRALAPQARSSTTRTRENVFSK